MREINSKENVFVWVCTSAAGLLRMSGPKEMGGLDDRLDLVRKEAQRSGRSIIDIADEVSIR